VLAVCISSWLLYERGDGWDSLFLVLFSLIQLIDDQSTKLFWKVSARVIYFHNIVSWPPSIGFVDNIKMHGVRKCVAVPCTHPPSLPHPKVLPAQPSVVPIRVQTLFQPFLSGEGSRGAWIRRRSSSEEEAVESFISRISNRRDTERARSERGLANKDESSAQHDQR